MNFVYRRTDGRTEGQTDRRTDGQMKGKPENIMPPATKVAGGIMKGQPQLCSYMNMHFLFQR